MPKPSPPDLRRLCELNELVSEGLELSSDERRAWLASLTPGQRQLLQRHRSRLDGQAGVETDEFATPMLPLLAQALAAETASPSLVPGQFVGPYRLLSLLGEGGHASVWLAQKEDGSGRRVALKLPYVGWSPGQERRALQERDLLASLEHPNIARLYEAGLSAEGRPWLAMEAVDGEPIDLYCRTRQLALRQRLDLMLQVIEAVAFAQARLVVHRDIKPANILVDRSGRIRLLDFGMARLLEGAGAVDQALTRRFGAALTPEYAAPEQADGRPVTTATDVYALGVVLFELLVGERPYALGPDALGRLALALQDVPVRAPSVTAELLMASGKEVPVAPQRLRGDLDTIVLHALAKDPSMRYGSAEALAADLRRHRDGEPVLARAPNWRYRAAKFLQRNRLPVAAATLVFTATAWGGRCGVLAVARSRGGAAGPGAPDRAGRRCPGVR